ncbi:hypothetical protein [Salibacterium qingdaonense]|uniref:Uncharacterized protein n=1 Tax=Salibacterium qingdaonense TaxID=266892 RepID=A0A1I4NWZ1_9BACI|nr:hypothetical protein [Salibacterium qingdaonense]SFM19989.1 hypothetical protein SAMN04488054_12119 [Salibacterium qingdaonense]
MTPDSPLELEALEVYLQPDFITQMEWAKLYRNICRYVQTVTHHDMVRYPEKAEIMRKMETSHFHIQIKRAFTTDVILLYLELACYINQEEVLIMLGVSNNHGRISTPLIIDLIVLIHTQQPGLIRVKGYLHPEDWTVSLYRLQERGLLMK